MMMVMMMKYQYLFHRLFRILRSLSFVLQWKISHLVQIALKDTQCKVLITWKQMLEEKASPDALLHL